ncbi:MAG: nitrate/nitrite transporter NrtS [Cyanobacteria bacterium]|nr:nitrate/nitrite transporter NrtS [Cyanobacteriota bacterium]
MASRNRWPRPGLWGAVLAYGRCLGDRDLAPTALRVALTVGTLLLLVNHGRAIATGAMTRDRWIAALLTYGVPYCVNIHGQAASRTRSRQGRQSPEPPTPTQRP